MTCASVPKPVELSTFTGMSCAFVAIPTTPSPPLNAAATVPATCVPCPWSSLAGCPGLMQLAPRPGAMLAARSGWSSLMPVSTTATRTGVPPLVTPVYPAWCAAHALVRRIPFGAYSTACSVRDSSTLHDAWVARERGRGVGGTGEREPVERMRVDREQLPTLTVRELRCLVGRVGIVDERDDPGRRRRRRRADRVDRGRGRRHRSTCECEDRRREQRDASRLRPPACPHRTPPCRRRARPVYRYLHSYVSASLRTTQDFAKFVRSTCGAAPVTLATRRRAP